MTKKRRKIDLNKEIKMMFVSDLIGKTITFADKNCEIHKGNIITIGHYMLAVKDFSGKVHNVLFKDYIEGLDI